MGKGNAAVRQWMSNPKRFADLFNGMVCEGEQVIRPEELEPADGETDLLLEDKNGKLQEVHRCRDLVMRWKRGCLLVLLACENQAKIHYAMSVRNMLYDSLSYVEQIQKSWKEKKTELKAEKLSSAEFLSKFRKGDKLMPVITLVFYYADKPWDGSKDLYGMLQWSKEEKENIILKKYVQNYRINLIDAGNIKNLERFQTDLQEIFGMIQCKESKEKLIEYLRKKESYFRNVDEETYQAIREFLHSEKILKSEIKKEEGKETVDMCKALEDLYNDGIEKGIQGLVEIVKDLGIAKEIAVRKVMEKYQCAREQAEQEVQKYWG